ncbi:hypothetical protein H0Z11_01105 (plasmid) [Pantoea agglomerans]|uniref:hypothetical protein n=1 Tax=Enterobacter agglomerans TaxID=549 RepID=UPI001A9E851B|nr:hypothetical protein [Pantoea agglomerans]QTC48689.1 hypothetical protein H0Z11_01105 [Pantoea agglomerans]
MKAYAFQTPMQAMSLLEEIKNDEFQWFNLEWEGRYFTCPHHFIKRLSSRSYIKAFWR